MLPILSPSSSLWPLPSLHLVLLVPFSSFVGLEVAGGGRVVSLEGNCMESTLGWLEPHADLHMQLS